MYSGTPPMNPTSQAPDKQGGGELEQLASIIAELDDQSLMQLIELTDELLSPRGIDLEMATTATKSRKQSRSVQQEEPAEEAQAAGPAERSGRVVMR